MRFRVQFAVINAAFDGVDRPVETARILRDLADRIERGGIKPGDNLLIRDINGNAVGQATLKF